MWKRKMWKRELGLCERRTSCKNKPIHGKTLCEVCSEYLKATTDKNRRREYGKKYQLKNKESLDVYSKNYQKKNLDKFRSYNKKYRSTEKGKALSKEKAARDLAAFSLLPGEWRL